MSQLYYKYINCQVFFYLKFNCFDFMIWHNDSRFEKASSDFDYQRFMVLRFAEFGFCYTASQGFICGEY